MASITASGVGSGIDVNSLVSQLITAEKTPESSRLDLAQQRVQADVSALGSFKSALSSLQSSVTALKSGGAITQLSATSSNTDLFTATTASNASPGSYQ